jgi:hypothetical protein
MSTHYSRLQYVPKMDTRLGTSIILWNSRLFSFEPNSVWSCDMRIRNGKEKLTRLVMRERRDQKHRSTCRKGPHFFGYYGTMSGSTGTLEVQRARELALWSPKRVLYLYYGLSPHCSDAGTYLLWNVERCRLLRVDRLLVTLLTLLWQLVRSQKNLPWQLFSSSFFVSFVFCRAQSWQSDFC